MKTDTRPTSDAIAQKFIAILGSAWMNDSGHGIHYAWDGETFDSRKAAIAHGLRVRESDDFNVGVVENGKLVSLDWMSDVVDSDPAALAEIAEQIDLTPPTREIAAQPGEGERCPQCDSADLEWDVAYRNVSGGVVEGRLRTQDVRCVFVLGCNSCSETLKVVPAEQVRYSPPHVADALDGERLDFLQSRKHSVFGMEGGGFDVVHYDANNCERTVASGSNIREAIDAAIAARAEAGGNDHG